MLSDAERTDIRLRLDLYNRLQKLRVAEWNRSLAVARRVGDIVMPTVSGNLHRDIYKGMLRLEQRARQSVEEWFEEHKVVEPILSVLENIRGVGALLATYLVGYIDIRRNDTVSQLWRYAGYGVVDGKAERARRGEKLRYNPRLKSVCWRIGMSFIMLGGPYRDYYLEQRSFYRENRPEWSPVRQHNAALRKTIKLFLAHLWETWRRLEGLPVRPPYLPNSGCAKHAPQDFGWVHPTEGG